MDLNELLNNNISKPTNEIEINKIDIYLKQRTGRKYVTEIFGINFNDQERLKTFAKDLRKKFSCCCSIEKNDNNNLYLKLSSKELTKYKTKIIDPKRENYILERLNNKKLLDNKFVKDIWTVIFKKSCKIQKNDINFIINSFNSTNS